MESKEDNVSERDPTDSVFNQTTMLMPEDPSSRIISNMTKKNIRKKMKKNQKN